MPSETPADPRNASSSLSTTISDTVPPRRSSGRRKKGPKPWYVLKLSVALAASVIAYSAYVYIGRLCIPMIRRERNSLGSRTLGIVFLVVFVVLGMMMIWAYIMAVFTPPGYAIKHVYMPHRPEAPAAESSGQTDTYTTFAPPPSERQRSANTPQSQRQTRSGQKLPTRAITPQRKQHRYCETCGIVKPPRAHHCRACGMCVLRFDHHCPWIGQCVGAQNQKFFFVFVAWDALFCLWTFTTLLALNVRMVTRTRRSVDSEHIVAIVLSGLFSIFTTAMLSTHIVLISTNQTTVEHIVARATKERESAVLDEMHSFWAFRAKRRTRLEWDAQYGRIGREGNMWWLGSVRANWEQVFGPHTWTWFLPIGMTKDKGLDFPRNPRFNADGVWLPRKQWPPGLR
ncbi:DHHC palmitoyltransferase-domain-containing protein [Russula compacta]|nr:DHHC palmitoyltransferase-domain-containing protein [Russula compacta]